MCRRRRGAGAEGAQEAGPPTGGDYLVRGRGGRPTTYTFARGGVLVYSYNGQTYTSGSWKQTGVTIYWETNKRYAEFEGTVTGNEMAGKAWNVAGGRWDLKMKRDPNPSPPR